MKVYLSRVCFQMNQKLEKLRKNEEKERRKSGRDRVTRRIDIDSSDDKPTFDNDDTDSDAGS